METARWTWKQQLGSRLASGLIAVVLFTMAACGGQSDPPAAESDHSSPTALIFVTNDGDGTVSVIEHGPNGNKVSKTLQIGSGNLGDMVITTEDHLFINVTDNNQVAAVDLVGTGTPSVRNFLPTGTRPVHGYRDPEGTRVWVLNDSDATVAPCKTAGPSGVATGSVTVIQNHDSGGGSTGGGTGGGVTSGGTLGEVKKTICVGRGHHKAAFSEPSAAHPNMPRRAFVSNITDGTISVIENNLDRADCVDSMLAGCLPVIATIDLCDPAKQSGGCDTLMTTANGAVPHGMDFSPVSGKIYNANVGYGTIAVINPTAPIDPITQTLPVETVIDIGFANKAHISPDGRFLIVKGTDTKSDVSHIHGKLTVISVADNTFTTTDLLNIHPDGFEFTPDGKKLYVTTATNADRITGLPTHPNQKNNLLLVFDTSNLPALTGMKEIKVGVADGGHRALAIHERDGKARHVFVPNPHDGTVSVVDVEDDAVVDTITVGPDPGSIVVFGIESHEDDEPSHH